MWTPKYRFRVLTGLVKDLVEHDIRMLSDWKGCEVIEFNVQADHVHLVVNIPPKVAVSELMAGPPLRHLERQISDQTLQSDRRSGVTLS